MGYSKKSTHDLSKVGGRIKYLRDLMGVSQRKLAEFGLKTSTLARIESHQGEITLKQANILIRIAQEKGIYCSLQWLVSGEGESPHMTTSLPFQPIHVPIIEEYKNTGLLRDIIQFTEKNPDSAVILIKDESMVPYFKPGEYVGGSPIKLDKISELFDIDNAPYKHCIIKFKNGQQLLRSVKKVNDDKLKLIKPNTLLNSSEQIINIKDIHSIYSVTWHGTKKTL